MPEPQGPWSFPPAAPPPPRPPRRVPVRTLIWLGVVALAVAAFFGLSALFPGQLKGMDEASALQALGLLALVSSGLVFARRMKLGEVARNLAIWGAIGGAALLGYSFRAELTGAFQRVRGELIPAYAVSTAPHSLTLTAGEGGHFYVMGQVNGASVQFVVDTGSTEIVLSPADAQRAGVDLASLKYAAPSETANGVGYGAAATLASLQVGPLKLENVPVEVNQTPMSASLLGMTFLKRLDSFDVQGDQLTLHWKG